MKEIDLKENYGSYFKVGLLTAIVFLLAGFVVFPSYSPKLDTRKAGVGSDTLFFVGEVLPPEAVPPTLPRPAIPEEARRPEEVEVGTIPGTDSLFWAAPQDGEQLPAPGTFTIYEEEPSPIRVVKPEYPEIARMAEIEGTVYLYLLIDKAGEVRDVMVVRPLNDACDSAAVRAVRQWLFSPALQADKPVAVWIGMAVDFRLSD